MIIIAVDIKKIIKSSAFIGLWKEHVYKSLTHIYDDLDDDVLDKVLDEKIEKNLQLPLVTLDNNYTGENKKTNLLSVLDWLIERKPLIAGNATFYKNQHEAMNPIAVMLKEFLTQRKTLKKLMFKIEDIFSSLYKDLDRGQLNEKISANSYYGASGMPRSPFYSQWSGPATTCTAQSVISTTETFFEGFMVKNYKFISINECFHYMNKILEEDTKVHKWVNRISSEELIAHIQNSFYDDVYKDSYEKMIVKYVMNLDSDKRTKIFYKFNLLEFIKRHEHIIDLYRQIFTDIKNHEYAKNIDDVPSSFYHGKDENDKKKIVKDYNKFVNKEFFLDPNEPPESIIDALKELNGYLMQYVHMPLMMFDRIHRLKYFNRKVVCIVDTDSNILTLDAWTAFCNKYILDNDYGRTYEYNKFIMVNSVTYFLTAAVSDILLKYGEHSNIPEDHRHHFSMKNEFYFNKLIVGRKKKRYMSAIKLREGSFIEGYKADVKGYDYMKSTTSDLAKSRFDRIVRKRILEDKCVDIPGIMRDLKDFENDIRQSLLDGDKLYLPLGSAKNIEAYKDPYTQQGLRGAIAWNFIYPDKAILFPAKVSILKLNIFTLDDIRDLKDVEPEIYHVIKTKIFESPIKGLSSKGLQILSIPPGYDIPEWCKKYIDYNTVINNIISQFKGVTDSFGIEYPEVGKDTAYASRKTVKMSNIVRF